MGGWTWLEGTSDHSECTEEECCHADEGGCSLVEEAEAAVAELDLLAAKHASLRADREQRGWREQSDREEGRDYEDAFEEDPAGRATFEASRRMRDTLEEAQLAAIEDRIHALGARLCRPYEHWNEDEAFMEWSERDRGDE